MWGLEHSQRIPNSKKTVTSRLARYSYGIICSRPFDYALGHLYKDAFFNQRGEWLAKNQMIWKLKKGERIEEGKELHVELTQYVQASVLDTIRDDRTWDLSSELYYCAEDDPPTRSGPSKHHTTETEALLIVYLAVKTLCKVEYSVPRSKLWSAESFRDEKTGQKWRSALFDFGIRLDSTTLEFFIMYKDELMALTEAKYKEDF